MERLIKNEILHDLDFTNLNIYVDCIKGKQTKHTKKGATRSTQFLEIVQPIFVDYLMLILSERKSTLSPFYLIDFLLYSNKFLRHSLPKISLVISRHNHNMNSHQ